MNNGALIQLTFPSAKFYWLKMVLMTLVARVADGLPLAASIQDEEQVFYFLDLISLL